MIEEFKRLTGSLPYLPHAIFPSEMFLFYREVVSYNIDHIIESGVRHGGSTRYLSRLFPNLRITSVDKEDRDIGLTEFHMGNAIKLLPEIVTYSSRERLAVLIDGPKGQVAIDLANRLLSFEKMKLVAIHDLDHSAGLRSRDENFRREFGYLDEKVGEYLKSYPNGPGLTIFKCSI